MPKLTIVVLLALAASAVNAGAHDKIGDAGLLRSLGSVSTPKEQAARLFFSDRGLVTQHGESVAFYTDVLREGVVVINFIFTRCTDSCPTQTAKLAAVQSLLGDAVGSSVKLVSISVDPERDSPKEMRAYAARFDAKPGWLFLTGAKRDVDEVLRRLGQLVAEPALHTTVFILGSARSGHWIKVHPDAAPTEIARRARLLMAEDGKVAAVP